ncbi:hypothetical protein Cgig2_022097 [Carnegiea gigantea]|uniref:R13L1/DRL21-like LRR repeat region domain-containing protein n=1 Tax=Carnegiea gigantea TaxID=171969 RepID=A0A9Q1QNM1_9CARY|nr:hypothetical protein Cgig2_022097 [Carnegiea gigantea]
MSADISFASARGRRTKCKTSTAQLCDLKNLNQLKGSLKLVIHGVLKDPASDGKEARLSSKDGLELTLVHMNNLKGWWKEAGELIADDTKISSVGLANFQHLFRKSFPNLSRLCILGCPNLNSMPCCPMVEDLMLLGVSGTLLVSMAANSAASTDMPFGFFSKLKALRISNVGDLISLPEECLSHISSLDIQDPKLMNTSRLEEVFTISKSLLSLELTHCHNLRSLSGGLEHLTALENLVIWNWKELDISSSEDIDDGMPWKALKSLRSLRFHIAFWLAIYVPVLKCARAINLTACSDQSFWINRKMSNAQIVKIVARCSTSRLLLFEGELNDPAYEAKEANLISKHGLMDLHIEGDSTLCYEASGSKHDQATTLKGLKPHRNLKKLRISRHRVEELPSWTVNDNLCTSLPNLVEVELYALERCQRVPSFSQLPFLKRLNLCGLYSVEYMESCVPVMLSLPEEALFFPSLQVLELDSIHEHSGMVERSRRKWFDIFGICCFSNSTSDPFLTVTYCAYVIYLECGLFI